jgi:hypothetical protein
MGAIGVGGIVGEKRRDNDISRCSPFVVWSTLVTGSDEVAGVSSPGPDCGMAFFAAPHHVGQRLRFATVMSPFLIVGLRFAAATVVATPAAATPIATLLTRFAAGLLTSGAPLKFSIAT